MSAELMVWRAAEPVGRERAAAAYRSERRDTAGAKELAAELPGHVTITPHGALVSATPEEVDQLFNQVFALARALGLTCYDPQRDLVHNLAPLGAHPEAQLHTGDGMIVTNPDLGLVRDALASLSPQNPFVALVSFGQHFTQVSKEPGGYEVEYKEGTIVRALVADLAEVQRVFHEYATGDRAFLTRLTWQ